MAIPTVVDTTEGDTFKMKCLALNYELDRYSNWKQCRWERLKDKSYCRIDYRKRSGEDNYEVTDKCVGLDDHYFFGEDGLFKGEGNPSCGLDINPTSIKDEGDWRCSLVFQDPKNDSLCIGNATIQVQVIL